MKKTAPPPAKLIALVAMIMIMVTGCKKDDEPTDIRDGDGNIYSSVTIGNQVWLKENLKTTKLIDGTEIPYVGDGAEWISLRTSAMCWYNNNESNKSLYGGMYNWYTVNTGKLCPTGWHVPTDNEWKQLEKFLGMTQTEADGTEFRGTDEGGKLKEAGTAHWTAPNTGATNSTGFTALPGGFRSMVGGNFVAVGIEAYFWTSTAKSDIEAWERGLRYDVTTIDRYGSPKYDGFYVRCIKN